MSSETKPSLATQPEKPHHYSYLKEFRVEQCPLFLQHKCTQHRPYTCFKWHFMNQRRRRPVRKRDGTFNYSADVYCNKFDEATGTCEDGDDCSFLHRTAGDTERRYHLRYYKTGMCVHDTDSRGYCVKNGQHCAFAHGLNDLRVAVYDVRELHAMESAEADGGTGPNSLDKERNMMNDDPKWQDTSYVLSHYKTEPCKRPPRLCRQGYACPQYHNSRDKRRTPKKYKYRSTPCPNVKQVDEWGDPTNCESGDNCGYCHTRTEQQFHPEIYKSTKCNDMHQSGYCPRGAFCAFAHVDQEMSGQRDSISSDTGTNFAEILNNVLPPAKDRERKVSGDDLDNNSVSQVSTSLTLTGAVKKHLQDGEVPRARHHSEKTHQQRKSSQNLSLLTNAPPFYPTSDTVESVVGNALDELSLEEPLNVEASFDKDLDCDQNNILYPRANTGSVLRGSAPMNIPGGGIANHNFVNNSGLSPPQSSPLMKVFEQYTNDSGIGMGTATMNGGGKFGSFPGGMGSNPMLDFTSMSPGSRQLSQSPLTSFRDQMEVTRLRDENNAMRRQVQMYESSLMQMRADYERKNLEVEQAKRKLQVMEQQRDEAMNKINILEADMSIYSHTRKNSQELETISLDTLKMLQEKLQADLHRVDTVVYHQSATKCMVCRERNRSVTLVPCNHYVLCQQCASVSSQCPYCQVT